MQNEDNSKKHEVQIICPKRGVWQTYDVTDGLPAGVLCLLQDRQGYLWLGTGAGLCRYDGAEFLTYTIADGLADNYVEAICEDRQGRLWLGTGGEYFNLPGKGVSCLDGQCFITYTTADGLAGNIVMAICEDRQGRLWFGTWGGGVSCFDGHGWTTYTTADGLADNTIWAICEDCQGRLWFGTWSGGVSCFDGQRFITYTTADGLAHNNVMAICEDRGGRLWFGAERGNVSCFDGYGWTTYTIEDGLLDNHVNGIIQDQEGHFWFAHSSSGLTRFDPSTLQLLTEEPVTGNLTQDRGGHLWFNNGMQLCCLCFDTGFDRLNPSCTQHKFEGQQRRFNTDVFFLLEDSRGALWVGTLKDGLYCYDSPHTVWEGIPPLPPSTSGSVRHFTTQVLSLLEARDGTIWAGTNYPGSLCRFDGKAFEAIPTPHPLICRLFEDSCGRVWMGGRLGVGLSCYDGKQLVTYTIADGLPAYSVLSIVEDDAGCLWIGTHGGLCCFDGKQFTTYGKAQGLMSLFHECSAKDATGQLWFGTSTGGLYRYDGVHFQWLTEADGLPSNSVTGFLPQPDGSMIIGTFRGIVHYRPTATVPPRIEIREVVADRVYRNPTELELTARGEGHSHPSPPTPLPQRGEESRGGVPLLTISYHGLSFATRRMRYSYILEGYDPPSPPLIKGGRGGWQDTWENHIRYENLPIGEYTFKVIAINRDLVCSEEPATLKLTIRPDPRDQQVAALASDLATKTQHLEVLQREVGRKYHFSNIIGRSAPLKQVNALMEKAIDSGLTVLISGETGTGKELVAKAIHYQSPRKGYPLRELNCGAVPKELVASTLFGHRKGAFTGAHKDAIGLFEAPSGGTVFLDEVSEMSPEAQVYLLRALQEHQIQRVGETLLRDIDVRVIAATNRDLEAEVSSGRFREDLYYRLNVFPIHLPALRDRLDDIPLLAEHFLQKACRQPRKTIDGFASGVFEMLQSYRWPGNIRELENEIHRAVALVEEGLKIQTYHFSSKITKGESLITEILSESVSYSESLERFRRRLIENALRECGGNRSRAAKLLGMDRSSLIALLKRLGMEKVK